MKRVTIKLDHYDRGQIDVTVWDEATWWMGRRQWTSPGNEEWGTFDDADFEESKEQIDALLASAEAV